ncbi:calcium-binding protein [Tropicibacter oceani]|uniref:Calcium-binding protein n=1 Tax=Tropicibacter oceani TaxID=3058420 RepID=A0ABY8QLA5_9RHOB|nr:hypothetical protein [Tropicibacter oceani]WGW04793.1 hypothetical protein QF118_04375 [Tropicibacter oceani]
MEWSFLLALLAGFFFFQEDDGSSTDDQDFDPFDDDFPFPTDTPVHPELAGATPGTEFDDTLRATSDDQALRGLAGDDDLSSDLEGNTLFGEDGNDTLMAGHKAELYGGEGDDWLWGDDHSTLDGGTGNDTLWGFDDSTIMGRDGDDRLTLLRGGVAEGGEGNDTIAATNPSFGGPYTPAIGLGQGGNDLLSIHGNGTIDGGTGDDTLRAYLGESDTGTGTLTGGKGEDHFEIGTYPYGTLGDPQDVEISDYTPGEDRLVLDLGLGQSEFDAAGLPGGLTFTNETLSVEVETGAGKGFDIKLTGITDLPPEDIYLHDYVTGKDLPFLAAEPGQTTTTPDAVNLFGDGNDTVTHDTGRAVINLGAGDNTIFITGGSPEVVAGAGDDTFVHSATDAPAETPYVDLIEPVLVPKPGDNPALASYFGGEGDDSFTVTGDYIEAFGEEGDDSFIGAPGSGYDVAFNGGSGADSYDVQFGQDVFDRDPGSAVTLTITPEAMADARAGEDAGWLPVDAEISVVVPAGTPGPFTVVPDTSNPYQNYGIRHYYLVDGSGVELARFVGGPGTSFEPVPGTLPSNISVTTAP